MSDFGNRPPPRVKNALDNKKLNLYAPCPTAPGKNASLTWQLHNNNPRLIVWTNDPSEDGNKDKGYGKIVAALDGPVFFGFLTMLQDAIACEGEYKGKLRNKAYTFFNRQRSETPVENSMLHVVKDADGVIFLSVTAKDRPVIKFVLSFSDFHEFIDGKTGSPLSAAQASVMAARAYVTMLTSLMTCMMATNWVEPPPPKQQGGGNGGGGGYSKGGGGGYNGGGNSGGGGGSAGGDDMPW